VPIFDCRLLQLNTTRCRRKAARNAQPALLAHLSLAGRDQREAISGQRAAGSVQLQLF